MEANRDVLAQVPANARELPTIQTAEHLKAIGYSSNFDPMKLYPEVYAVDEETIKKTIANAPSLKEILGNTASKLQEARTRATGLDNLLALATESLEVCADMRKADLADSLIENLKDDVGCPVLPIPIYNDKSLHVLTLHFPTGLLQKWQLQSPSLGPEIYLAQRRRFR